MSDPPTEADGAAAAVLELWDRLIRLATHIRPDDWSRPTPCPDADVGGLITHVAGVHGALGAPVDALRSARAAQEAQIAAWSNAVSPTSQRRLLRASCLDLWVHAYDLATALGEPVDLDDEGSPALTEACSYLLDHVPHLLARRSDPAEISAVRIALRGIMDDDSAQSNVTAKPGAFVLLLSGRGDPDHWRDLGALAWSGAGGEAFVHKARLLG